MTYFIGCTLTREHSYGELLLVGCCLGCIVSFGAFAWRVVLISLLWWDALRLCHLGCFDVNDAFTWRLARCSLCKNMFAYHVLQWMINCISLGVIKWIRFECGLILFVCLFGFHCISTLLGCPVGWGYRIHRLLLCRGVRPRQWVSCLWQ